MASSLETYYRLRADEYDEVYRKPERQRDLRELADLLRGHLADREVLEVAAGTGYWTEAVSAVAHSITATDAVGETLQVAERRRYEGCQPRFSVCDAFSLDRLPGTFNAGLAGFWLSHLRRDQMEPFLRHLGSRLAPGSTVVLTDNRFVEGSNHPISRTDRSGNTSQRRRLHDGTSHEVLKNFPTADELLALGNAVGTSVRLALLSYYWQLTYVTPGPSIG